MSNYRMIIWWLFISTFIFLFGEGLYIHFIHHLSLNIIGLELADKVKGTTLLLYFHEHHVNGMSLIYYAIVNTYVDYFFILGYVGIIFIITGNILHRQQNGFLRTLLRLCFYFGGIAGVLDLVENSILLMDLHQYYTGKDYVSAMYVSYPKWILAGVVVLIWLICIICSRLKTSGPAKRSASGLNS